MLHIRFPLEVPLSCRSLFAIINSVSVYICARGFLQGMCLEIESLSDRVVLSSPLLLDIARLLSKVAVPNYIWNIIYVLFVYFLLTLVFLANLMRSASFPWILLQLSLFLYVHWLFLICPFTPFGHFLCMFLFVLIWRRFYTFRY